MGSLYDLKLSVAFQLLQKKKRLHAWGDSPVVKAFATQAQPGVWVQSPCKCLMDMAPPFVSASEEILRALWPTRLIIWQVLGLIERPFLDEQGGRAAKDDSQHQPWSPMCMWAHIHMHPTRENRKKLNLKNFQISLQIFLFKFSKQKKHPH